MVLLMVGEQGPNNCRRFFGFFRGYSSFINFAKILGTITFHQIHTNPERRSRLALVHFLSLLFCRGEKVVGRSGGRGGEGKKGRRGVRWRGGRGGRGERTGRREGIQAIAAGPVSYLKLSNSFHLRYPTRISAID